MNEINTATRAVYYACRSAYGSDDVAIMNQIVHVSFGSANMAVAHTDKIRAICEDADVIATIRANEAQATIHISGCSYDVGDE